MHFIEQPETETTMNILKKEDKSMAPIPSGGAVAKRSKFSWASDSPAGAFCMIAKTDLNIDGSYQRDQVSENKVREIARDWDWRLLGALSVIMRPDGTLWVYDGGHRARASFLRDDIVELPCMVFECETVEEEAKAFVGANTMKSGVSAFHKYHGSLRAKEPEALAIKAVLDKYGYKAVRTAGTQYGFASINTLKKLLKEDSDLAERVFGVCSGIAEDGSPFSGVVLRGIFRCAKKLEGKADILKNGHLKKLNEAGIGGIEMAIRRESHIAGKGGEVVAAKAILDLLNKGKHRRMSFA